MPSSYTFLSIALVSGELQFRARCVFGSRAWLFAVAILDAPA
jgi:hypothetical protein